MKSQGKQTHGTACICISICQPAIWKTEKQVVYLNCHGNMFMSVFVFVFVIIFARMHFFLLHFNILLYVCVSSVSPTPGWFGISHNTQRNLYVNKDFLYFTKQTENFSFSLSALFFALSLAIILSYFLLWFLLCFSAEFFHNFPFCVFFLANFRR